VLLKLFCSGSIYGSTLLTILSFSKDRTQTSRINATATDAIHLSGAQGNGLTTVETND